MATILFAYGRWSMGASIITQGSEQTTAPAANLRLPHPSDFWQTINLATAWVELFNDTASPSWDFIGLLYSNGVIGDTWRIRTAATQGNLTASPAFDSGNVALYASATVAQSVVRPSLFTTTPARTEPWLRVDVTSTSPDGYFRAGNLIIDTQVLPGRNFQFPLDIGPPARLDLKFLSESDAMTLKDLGLQYEGSPVLIVYDPANTSYLHNWLVWGVEQTGNNPRLTRREFWAKRYQVQPYI